MSDQLVRIITAGVLLLHGLGHGGALGALAWIAARTGTDTGAWAAARLWLVPSLASGMATPVASGFWILSLVGFVAAALGFWFGLGDWWRTVALGSAVISTVGIIGFLGTWPLFNTVAALAVNAFVIVGIGIMRWTSPAA